MVVSAHTGARGRCMPSHDARTHSPNAPFGPFGQDLLALSAGAAWAVRIQSSAHGTLEAHTRGTGPQCLWRIGVV